MGNLIRPTPKMGYTRYDRTTDTNLDAWGVFILIATNFESLFKFENDDIFF